MKARYLQRKREKSKVRRNVPKQRESKTVDAFTCAEGIHYKSGGFNQRK